MVFVTNKAKKFLVCLLTIEIYFFDVIKSLMYIVLLCKLILVSECFETASKVLL